MFRIRNTQLVAITTTKLGILTKSANEKTRSKMFLKIISQCLMITIELSLKLNKIIVMVAPLKVLSTD